MKRAVDVVSENFNTMRTGRANPAILDKIIVDYYGTPTPLKSLASVSVPDASTLIVAPYDRGGLRDVEKAILESDIGINPSNDGEKIRLAVPPMTQVCMYGERRGRGGGGGKEGATSQGGRLACNDESAHKEQKTLE
jgi:ribosome recycling factor